jgi:hypothetical protein
VVLWSTRAGPHGAYRLAVGDTADVAGGEEVNVTLTTSSRDQVTAQTQVPQMVAKLTSGEVTGCTQEGHAVTASLLSGPGGTLLERHSHAVGPAHRCYDLTFASPMTKGRFLTADFASDASVRMPSTVTSRAGTVATVHCLPNRPVRLDWSHGGAHSVLGTASGGGVFSTDLNVADPGVNPNNLPISVECQTTPGDLVSYTSHLPVCVGTVLSAAASAGDTNIKVASVAAMQAGQVITIDGPAIAETATISSVGTAGATGTGVTLTQPLVRAHASGVTVIGPCP